MANLVEVRGLKVEATTDSGRRVDIIKGVDLDVAEGEIVALIGESGSGKTTIALTVMGHARPGCRIAGGSVVLAGRDMATLPDAERAKARGTVAAYVPQSAAAAFNPARTLIDQVTEVCAIHQLMPPAQARARAVELFRALSLPEPETIGARYPHQVSGGQLQRLSAAMALIGDPRIVIFDEPTTALDVTTQIEVLRAFKTVMKDRGTSGIYVSHDLAVVAQIADRIVVLKDGEVQESGSTEAILNQAQHPYTRELLAAFRPEFVRTHEVTKPVEARSILTIEGLVAGYGAIKADGMPTLTVLKNIELDMARGTNFGIIGESGCGKSTLARAIAGIVQPVAGTVMFDGQPLGRTVRERSLDQLRRLQIVFQLADTALNPRTAVGDILGRPLTLFHGMRGRRRQTRVNELLDMVRLPSNLKYRLPGELSGGQKQRVNLARALAAEPDLIICDEITSALDTVVAAAVIDLLRELQREIGLSYLFISHDLSLVQSICDRIAVMYEGEKIEELTAGDFGREETHPYSRLLHASTPKLDPAWLDTLDWDPATVRRTGVLRTDDAAR